MFLHIILLLTHQNYNHALLPNFVYLSSWFRTKYSRKGHFPDLLLWILRSALASFLQLRQWPKTRMFWGEMCLPDLLFGLMSVFSCIGWWLYMCAHFRLCCVSHLFVELVRINVRETLSGTLQIFARRWYDWFVFFFSWCQKKYYLKSCHIDFKIN